MEREEGIRQVGLTRLINDITVTDTDLIVVEDPLEMVVEYGESSNRKRFTLAITMRTPGNDEALVRGFLLTEGIVDTPDEILKCIQPHDGTDEHQSIIAELSTDVNFSPERQQRHFYTTSSCGVCGKTSIDMVRQVTSFRPIPGQPAVTAKSLNRMSGLMRNAQSAFQKTGGMHAAGLFDSTGELLAIKEDVGRHNAVDKLIGTVTSKIQLPLNNHIMLVSGRAGFELVQKAAVVGVALFAAVGAPSSLAVELAEESNMTLVGFLNESGLNIYTHKERIIAG